MPSLQAVANSILAVEIGSVWTHALLIDLVEGAHRFVAQGEAPSTVRPPHADLLLGLRAAIRKVEARTGRVLLDEQGDLVTPEDAAGRGVDLLVCTASGLEPLRVAAAGLAMRGSAAAAQQGAQSRPSTISHVFALDAPGGRWGTPQGAAGVAEHLLRTRPDALVLVGEMAPTGTPELREVVGAIALASEVLAEEAPAVIWAGGSEGGRARRVAGSELRARLDGAAQAGSATAEPVARLMEQLYHERRLSRLPGMETLKGWGAPELISPTEAWTRVAQYLAIRNNQRVLALDVGGRSATLAAATPSGATQSVVRPELGLAQGDAILEQVEWERVAGWVPSDRSPDALRNLWMTLALHPAQQPASQEALGLLQGAARESLRLLVESAPPLWEPRYPGLTTVDLILGGGRVLRHAPRAEQALAILLDAVQPIGITHLLRDRVGIVPAIGALAGAAPQAAAGLIAVQSLESLGVVITPIGEARAGQEMVQVRLTSEGGTTEGVVEQGQSYRFPTNGRTQLELHPLKNIDLGLGPNVPVTLTREGDSVGFVIDARGRPLPLADNLEERRARAGEWMRYVGA